MVFEDKVSNDFYLEKLEPFMAVSKYREAEVYVDTLGYKVERSGKEFRVLPPCDDLGKSIDLGHQNLVQQLFGAGVSEDRRPANVPSLENFCHELVDGFSDVLVQIRKEPVERIVMGIPEGGPFEEFLTTDQLFREEMLQIRILQKELLLTDEQFFETRIVKSLTGMDILKFQRLWYVFLYFFRRFVSNCGLSEDPLFFRSMIPVFGVAELTTTLTRLYGPERAEGFIDAFTWRSEDDTIFDLQSQPFLRCGDYFMLPLAIVAKSNLLRNAMVTHQNRYDSEADVDPVGDMLEDQFKKSGFAAFRPGTMYVDGSRVDVDFVAIAEEKIFIFECTSVQL